MPLVDPTGTPQRPWNADTIVERARVLDFLAHETLLLDEDRLAEWYNLLDDDFVYEVPIRVVQVRRRMAAAFPAGSYHQRDTKGSVRLRIDRLKTDQAWAEDPPTRTARIVGNIALDAPDENGVVRARCPVLIYREHPQIVEPDIIAGRREDRIVERNGALRLLSRTVWLAQTTISTPNLGIFL